VLGCGDPNSPVISPGVCDLSYVCNNDQTCLDNALICKFFGGTDADCAGLGYTCQDLVIGSEGPVCGSECNSDADCAGGDICQSGCGGTSTAGSLFCTAPNHCVNPETYDCP